MNDEALRKTDLDTITLYRCSSCQQAIPLSPRDSVQGVIVHGNIHVADLNKPGGLIGDNFPTEDKFSRDDVKRQVFCVPCLLTALQIAPAARVALR